jgi:hypothetical protein
MATTLNGRRAFRAAARQAQPGEISLADAVAGAGLTLVACSAPIQIGTDTVHFAMILTSKVLGAVVVVFALAASQANADQSRVRGPVGYGHGAWKYRYTARSYTQPQPDLGAAIAAALAGAALQLVPGATEALIAKLPPGAAAPLPPVETPQLHGWPPGSDVLDNIEGNSRGITRQEVEAAIVDWCATHADAPLCVKLQVTPPPPSDSPTHEPAPDAYYRAHSRPSVREYYWPGRFQTWNGCQEEWTVQDGLCKPYRGY